MAQIKYKLGNLGKEKYSTDETAIGTWIDGKTIYRTSICMEITINLKILYRQHPDLII